MQRSRVILAAMLVSLALSSSASAETTEFDLAPGLDASSQKAFTFHPDTTYTITVSGTLTREQHSETCVFDLAYEVSCNASGVRRNGEAIRIGPPGSDPNRTGGAFGQVFSDYAYPYPDYREDHIYTFTYTEGGTSKDTRALWALPQAGKYNSQPTTYTGGFHVKIVSPEGCAAPTSARIAQSCVAPPEMRIKRMSGEVTVRRPGGQWRLLEPTDVLTEDDEVATGVDSALELEIDGDLVDLREVTMIRLAKLQTREARRKILIELRVGEVNATVKPRQTVDTNFDIKTPTATASVRGTTFAVFYDPIAKASLISVKEGSVSVNPARSGPATQKVGAGKEVEVTGKSVSRIVKIGKAGARGGINRAKAVERALARVAAAADKCGISTPRKAAFSAKGARKGWHVTVKLTGSLKGASKWKVRGKRTTPANALARRVAGGCA